MTRILVVDDEPQLLRALQINLQARQYDVTTAADGTVALDETARARPDAIILDLGLPGLDGLQVIAALRVWSSVPVIVLSGRSGADEKVAALDAGADDYLTKPFAMNELLARLRAVLRRPSTEDPLTGTAVIGDFTVDLVGCTVSAHREGTDPVRLTRTEWRILTLLVQHPGRLVTGPQILHSVWGPGHEDKNNYLRVYLAGLRRKLERDPAHPRHLRTEPGMGYRFDP
ncbi:MULTISPECIES: response regulator [Streptacidiphilus]|uniref:Response regulator n=1 Tax=Streptacidiphilus cavernicola TaxID=3342716 RepID=A0ABV6UKA8_9ACTN|nr:response regulator transcription factor [Streptacidiphilus jeojiense]